MLTTILLISVLSLVPICLSECIRFEFHEKIDSSFDQSDLIRAMCLGKGGKIVDYSLKIIQLSGPLIFNVTFHCCAPSPCLSDHDCPINFNCNHGLCSVADCNLTDEPEIILQEGRTCFIDDDCYFETPFDSDNWKCLPDPWCFHNKTCDISYNFCKRCPTGYIDVDPKRFTSSDGTIQPPTTSSPWWLTASPTLSPSSSSVTPPTINSHDIHRIHYPLEPEHSVPNRTESPIDFVFPLSTLRANTPSTTPDPITVGYDELSPNNDENHSNNNNSVGNSTSVYSTINATSSNFGAADLPVNLSDDELISNVSLVELARIDSVDSIDDDLNSTEISTPLSISSSSSSPDETSSESPISDPLSYSTIFESRQPSVAPLVTSNPFAWPGLFDSDLNRTSTIRNSFNSNNRAIERSTTIIPNFTDINYI